MSADTGHRLGRRQAGVASLIGLRSDKGRLTGSCWTGLGFDSLCLIYSHCLTS